MIKNTRPLYSGTYFDALKNPAVYRDKTPLDLHAETKRVMDTHNIAKESSEKYTKQEGLNNSESVPATSSLRKQASIAHAYHLATTGNEEYKKAVFASHQKNSPDLIKKTGAKNYDDLVSKSYQALASETGKQFKSLPIKTTFHNDGHTYPSSNHMLRDMHLHHHLAVFSGGDKHEFLHHVDPKNGLNENEKFRAVHDFYGHGIHGNQFGPKGEELAWGHHKKMFTPLAALSMTGETRGQNSWVNYSGANTSLQQKMEATRKDRNDAVNRGDSGLAHKHTEKLQHLGSLWNYAKQASVILPHEMNSPTYNGEIPESIKNVTKPAGKYDLKKDPKGFVALARHHNTSSHNGVGGGVLNQEGFHSDLTHILQLHGHTV